MKIKTSELQGAALVVLVAKCEGVVVVYDRMNGWWETSDPRYAEPNDPVVFDPSTDWTQGGPIIEREKMRIAYNSDEHIWEAGWDCHVKGWGDTPLVAAMRCYVASKLGDEVDVPDELLQGGKL